MFKFVTSLLGGALVSAQQQAKLTKDDLDTDHFLGGIGNVDDPVKYMLISPELVAAGKGFEPDGQVNQIPKLWVTFYYPISTENGLRELHGDLYLETDWELTRNA